MAAQALPTHALPDDRDLDAVLAPPEPSTDEYHRLPELSLDAFRRSQASQAAARVRQVAWMRPLTKEALINYLEKRIPPGSMTRALLEGRVLDAALRADMNWTLPQFVRLLAFVQSLPSSVQGSPEVVRGFLETKGAPVPMYSGEGYNLRWNWCPFDAAYLRALYVEGEMSRIDLALTLTKVIRETLDADAPRVSATTAGRWLREAGLHVRNNSEASRLASRHARRQHRGR